MQVTGDFHAQDAVRLCDLQGREIGRGLINYTCEEVQRVKVGLGELWIFWGVES